MTIGLVLLGLALLLPPPFELQAATTMAAAAAAAAMGSIRARYGRIFPASPSSVVTGPTEDSPRPAATPASLAPAARDSDVTPCGKQPATATEPVARLRHLATHAPELRQSFAPRSLPHLGPGCQRSYPNRVPPRLACHAAGYDTERVQVIWIRDAIVCIGFPWPLSLLCRSLCCALTADRVPATRRAEQPGCIAAHYQVLVGPEPERADLVHRVVGAHVERVVRAEQDVVGPGVADQVGQEAAVMGDRVVVEPAERLVRAGLAARPGLAADGEGPAQAAAHRGEHTPAVGEQDPEPR